MKIATTSQFLVTLICMYKENEIIRCTIAISTPVLIDEGGSFLKLLVHHSNTNFNIFSDVLSTHNIKSEIGPYDVKLFILLPGLRT